jgi:hypothetical protein
MVEEQVAALEAAAVASVGPVVAKEGAVAGHGVPDGDIEVHFAGKPIDAR